MAEHTALHTPLPWEFRDGFIIANGEALKLVGVQIPMVSSAARVEAIYNAKLICTAVNTQPAVADLVKALEAARETILQLKNSRWSECEGSDSDWVGDIDSALSRFRELERGNG